MAEIEGAIGHVNSSPEVGFASRSRYHMEFTVLHLQSIVIALPRRSMGDSSYRLNFDQGKKNEIQHHS
jgi:hypothetical protein